jgi:aspartate aminotransferase
MITSPQNPTGAIYSKESLKIFADFVTKNNLWLISDEIYSEIVYPPLKFEPILKHFPKLKSRLVIVNGFSKSFAMTGFRIGYAAAPHELIELASNVHANTTSNVCSISQKAALAALTQEPNYPESFMKGLAEKRKFAFEYINSTNGISCNEPKGAFYLFPNVNKFIGKTFKSTPMKSSAAITDYLLTEHGVAIVPGEAFGAPGFIRISFAVDLKTLKKGLARIKKGLEQLK